MSMGRPIASRAYDEVRQLLRVVLSIGGERVGRSALSRLLHMRGFRVA